MRPLTKVLGMSPAMLRMTREGKLEARMKDLAVEAMVNLLDGGNIVLVDDEGIEREYMLRELDRSVLQKRQERACDHVWRHPGPLPKSYTGQAVAYCKNCPASKMMSFEDGMLRPSNECRRCGRIPDPVDGGELRNGYCSIACRDAATREAILREGS